MNAVSVEAVLSYKFVLAIPSTLNVGLSALPEE
jgi:hypothetical protein